MTASRSVARRLASKQTRRGRPHRDTPTRMFVCLAGSIWLAGCASALPVSGLRLEYPEAFAGFVEVDSLQPTLRWEAFPRPEDRAAATVGGLGQIREVTYDLTIWRGEEEVPRELYGSADVGTRPLLPRGRRVVEQYPADYGAYPGELVYFRRGLPVPWHRVEASLEPSTKYFGTIRARFELDGLPRATQWGVTAPNVSDPRVVRGALVPNPFHYRFKTP